MNLDIERKLNIRRDVQKKPKCPLNAWCTFNLRPVSKGYSIFNFDSLIFCIYDIWWWQKFIHKRWNLTALIIPQEKYCFSFYIKGEQFHTTLLNCYFSQIDVIHLFSLFTFWELLPFGIMTNVCHHLETSQLICSANQLTGFYMMGNTGR